MTKVWLFLFYFSLFKLNEAQVKLPRKGKFIFPFIIPPYVGSRVTPATCSGSSGIEGFCTTVNQCYLRGGTISGGSSCSKNGVCCTFQYSCGGSTSSILSYFNNPSSVSSGQNRCSFTINKFNSSICQIRLDFKNFDIAGPDSDGICLTDFLLLKDANIKLICGKNTGQHVYINFPSGCNSQTISVDTNANIAVDRSWTIRALQVPCGSERRALDGCLQFYTGTSGTVSSFNYDSAAPQLNQGGGGTRMLAGQSYGACIRQAAGYCSIEWSQSSSSPFSFTISGDTPQTTGTDDAALTGADCDHTFIIVPNPLQGSQSLTSDRFCGNGLATKTSSTAPFVLYVVTGKTANDTNIANRGFQLSYRQIPCQT